MKKNITKLKLPLKAKLNENSCLLAEEGQKGRLCNSESWPTLLKMDKWLTASADRDLLDLSNGFARVK